MDVREVIDISSEEGDNYNERRAILEGPIRSVVDALGGYEGGKYRLGDECYGCLKDLKKFWRKDDTDDERTVARIFWEARVLPNDLVPILLETAGNGWFEDKRAIACVDLMTAMTWPIDVAEELQELDDVMDKGTDYTQLLQSHLKYKLVILRTDVMQALMGIALPCIAKSKKERTDRDAQVIGVVLYLIRNLAFIKDLPANMYSSADQAEYSSLQSRLVKCLSETNILDLLLAMASNGDDDPMYDNWNVLILETFYLLFRGVTPASLAADQSKEPAQNLRRLLAVEDQRKRGVARNASSRHSRFGTTISVTLNPKAKQNGANPEGPADAEAGPSSQPFVLHRQQALRKEAGSMLDMASAKRSRFQKVKKVDELGRDEDLSLDAKLILQTTARTFLETCFNSFLASLLKDIKAERPKITEKDHLRLLFLTKWFLDFFLMRRASDKDEAWDFSMITEVTERGWIVWVLRRMREAMENKPKLWTELQAGVECLTQLILLIDCMIFSKEKGVVDAAEILQSQIIYNGEVLDIALGSVRVYKGGTQSLMYLDSSIHLAYALLRLLERCSKGSSLVRKKKAPRRKQKTGDSAVPDVEDEPVEEEEEVTETTFTFDAFEQHFAHPEVTQTLLTYLARYKEFKSPENMKRVVNLIHRQAIKAKAEGLFFNVSTLNLFKSILTEEKSLPRDQSSKDLINLINFILRQFFKAVAEDSFLLVEAFYPKTRGKWKQHSSWEPLAKKYDGSDDDAPDNRRPTEVKIKKGFTWSEEMGIAIKCLVEANKTSLVDWTKQILMMVIGLRQRIIAETDTHDSSDDDDDDMGDKKAAKQSPSAEALAKLTDYMIPYLNDEQANAVTKDPHLQLFFRLLKFAVLDDDSEELEWYVPAALVPDELQRSLNIIDQYLENPIDLGDKKAEQMLSKKRRRRRARRAASDTEEDEEGNDKQRKRKEKKKKEAKQYKSAQFVEDSDIEEDALEAFFAKEKALREKMALMATESGKAATMRATGTKKRVRGKKAAAGKRKRTEGESSDDSESSGKEADAKIPSGMDPGESSDEDLLGRRQSPKASITLATTSPRSEEPRPSKPKPRPRPRLRKRSSPPVSDSERPPLSSSQNTRSSDAVLEISDDDEVTVVQHKPGNKKKTVLIISDDDE